MGLGDFNFSLAMRDTIMRLSEERIEALRPKYRYGVVEAIDRVARTCDVTLNGETAPVTVNMGSLQPDVTGQTVRVGGVRGDRFIEDVLGVTRLSSDVIPSWECGGSVGQSIPNTADTVMRVASFGEAVGLSARSRAGFATYVTIANEGRYGVSMSARFLGGGNLGERACYIGIIRPGDPAVTRVAGSSFDGNRTGTLTAAGNLRLIPGDIVRPFVYQASGGDLALSDLAGTVETRFSGTLLSR